MDAPLCEHRHTLFLTFKIHTRCCVGMCECVCARHFKAATWPHLISNFEQLGVWLHGGTTNCRTHTENRKHLNRNHRGEVTTHLQVPGGPEAAAAAAPSPRTSWRRTEGWWRLSTVHTQTHTHTQTGQIWKPSERKHTKDVPTVTKSRLLFIWGVGGVGGSSSCSAPCSTTGKSSHQQQFVRAPLSVWASRVTRGKNQTRSQVSASLFNYLYSVAHPQVSLLTLHAPHNVRANGSPVFEAQLVGDDGNSAGNGRSLWELVMTAREPVKMLHSWIHKKHRADFVLVGNLSLKTEERSSAGPNESSGKRAPLFGFGRLSIASLRVIAVCRTFRGRLLCFPSYEITRCARTYAWFGCCLRMSCTGGTHRAVIPRVSGKSARFPLCVPAVQPSLNSPPVSQRESVEPKPSAPSWPSVLPVKQT